MTIRDFIESGTARPRPRIALMQPPTAEATRAALVTTVYHARELLSDAFRAIDELRASSGPLDPRPRAEALDAPHESIRSGTAMLSGAVGMLKSISMCDETQLQGRARVLEWLERAVAASKTASMHAAYTFTYRTPLADHDKRHFAKSLAIWARATEAAVQESHRALAELAELMPDAYAISDE